MRTTPSDYRITLPTARVKRRHSNQNYQKRVLEDTLLLAEEDVMWNPATDRPQGKGVQG